MQTFVDVDDDDVTCFHAHHQHKYRIIPFFSFLKNNYLLIMSFKFNLSCRWKQKLIWKKIFVDVFFSLRNYSEVNKFYFHSLRPTLIIHLGNETARHD